MSQIWWLTSLIPAPRKLRQEDCKVVKSGLGCIDIEFKASLGNLFRQWEK